MLNLETMHLEKIKLILKEHIPNKDVWAYGSRITNNAHQGSDLDLVVINPKDPAIPEEKITKLQEIFRESNIPFLIDIHDWANLPKSFQDEINQKHIPIQSSQEAKK